MLIKRVTTALTNTKGLLTNCPRRQYKVDTPPPDISKAKISKDRRILLIISKSAGYLGTGEIVKIHEETAIHDSLNQEQTQYLVNIQVISRILYQKKQRTY
jgi:hypothetical protein